MGIPGPTDLLERPYHRLRSSRERVDRTATTARPTPQAQYEHIMTTPAPPAIGAYIDAGVIGFVFGEMWRRGVLTPRDRRWVTLACVGAADAPIPMETHTYAALNSGDVTNEEIDEFLLFFGTQMGWPKGSAMNTHILGAMAKIAEERGEEMQLPRVRAVDRPGRRRRAPRTRRGRLRSRCTACRPPAATTAFRGPRLLRLPLRRGVDPRRVPHHAATAGWSRSAAARSSGVDAETTEHLEAALRAGELTYEELQEVVMHVAVYLGWIVARRLDDLLVDAAEPHPVVISPTSGSLRPMSVLAGRPVEGGAGDAREVAGGVDQRHVGERLREVAEHAGPPPGRTPPTAGRRRCAARAAARTGARASSCAARAGRGCRPARRCRAGTPLAGGRPSTCRRPTR